MPLTFWYTPQWGRYVLSHWSLMQMPNKHDKLQPTLQWGGRRDLCLILFLDQYYTAMRRDIEIINSLSCCMSFLNRTLSFLVEKLKKNSLHNWWSGRKSEKSCKWTVTGPKYVKMQYLRLSRSKALNYISLATRLKAEGPIICRAFLAVHRPKYNSVAHV